MLIGEISEKTNLPESTLRYYEKKGLIKVARDSGGRREYEDCDDRFAFIAGYTSGGTSYGTTWEEIGIDPELPFEKKVERLAEGNYSISEEDETNWDDEMPEMLVLPGLFSVCQVEDYSQVKSGCGILFYRENR